MYSLLTHEYFFYAIVAAISIGVYYARAAVSIGTGALACIALVTVVQRGQFQRLLNSKYTIALMSVFLVFLLSGINSANTQEWLSRLGDNLPFLAVPAGVWAYGSLGKKQISVSIGIFLVITTLSSVIVIGDYLFHTEEYNQLYKVGKTIPTPIIHVRYSFFLALAAVLAAGLMLDDYIRVKWKRIALMAVGLWLIICVHILAVRTGIFALYGAVLTLGVLHTVYTRRWKVMLITFAGMTAMIVGSVLFLPSVSNKIQYVLHDLKVLREQGVSPEYSDNLRLISIIHGMEIFVDHPVAGVGVGDVEDEMQLKYEADTAMIPAERRFPPISQYVFWLAAFGLLGTSALIGLLLFPVIRHGGKTYLLIGIYALTGLSFLAETSIQLQLGKTVFVLLVAIIASGLAKLQERESNPV